MSTIFFGVVLFLIGRVSPWIIRPGTATASTYNLVFAGMQALGIVCVGVGILAGLYEIAT